MKYSIIISISQSLAILLLGCVSLPAQVQNKPQDWMTWDGSRVVVIEHEDSRSLQIEPPESQGAPIIKLKGPDNTTILDFKESAAWASVRGSTKNPKATYLYRSLDLKTWEINATYLGERGRAWAIYHLDGKRYFMVSGPSFFSDQNEFSPFAIADINDKGFLILKNLVRLDLKEPIAIPNTLSGVPQPASAIFNPKYASLLSMFITNRMIRYPGGLVLVAKKPGYIWLFDNQSGALKRSIKLFSSVTEEKLGPPYQLNWAILGCQPRANGHLLVASREEDAVLYSMAGFPTQKSLKYINDEAQHKLNRDQDTASLLHWPRILWWDIDPKTGAVTEEYPPHNVPSQIWDLRVFQDFKFRFKPDGNLLVN